MVNIGIHYPLARKDATKWLRFHTVESATVAFADAYMANKASMPFVVWRETSPQHYAGGVHSEEQAAEVRRTGTCAPRLDSTADDPYNQVTGRIVEQMGVPILKVLTLVRMTLGPKRPSHTHHESLRLC